MNKEVTYESIWNTVIEPTIIRLKSSIDEELRLKYSFGNREILFIKNDIYNLYESKKERLKKLYHYDDGDTDRRIDIHKIASCFAAVLVENPIFEFEYLDADLPDDIFLSNARLAYSVSLGIVYIGLIHHYAKIDKKDILEKLTKNEKLFTPMTTKGHDEYSLGREKAICLNYVFGNEFDVLTYSDMLFWIEYYNRQILEDTLYPESMCDVVEND